MRSAAQTAEFWGMNMPATVAPALGSELKKLRQARGLSQNKLAGMACLSAAALSRWESGQRVPSIPELDAALTVLEASDAQKRTVLRLMNAPRALVQLRAIDNSGFEATASGGGGQLLWAMRKRRNWTQAETARASQVEQSQIARWERGEAWPNAQNLHAVCWALQAFPEEVAALTNGALSSGGRGMLASKAGMELWDEGRWATYIPDLLKRPPPDALIDLTFIQAEQQLAQIAHRHEFAARLLPDVYAIHARQHHYKQRFTESAKWAEQGFALLRQQNVLETVSRSAAPLWFGNVLLMVSHATQNNRPAGLKHGATLLRDWLPILRDSISRARAADARALVAAHYAWGQMSLASVVNDLGYTGEAVALGKEACHNAERLRPSEASMRWRDYGLLLHNAGYSARALDALAKSRSMVRWDYETPDAIARHCLLQARCFAALDDRQNADERAREAERIIKEANLRYLEPALPNLSRRGA